MNSRVLLIVVMAALVSCGDKDSSDTDQGESPACDSPYNERMFIAPYPSAFCNWREHCSTEPYDDVACLEEQITKVYCHEADPCLTEACIVALDRDFEEAPDDCALVPAACDGIFNLDVDRCAE